MLRLAAEPNLWINVTAPTDEQLQALLHRIITRLMNLLTRRGVLVEEQEGGSRYLADADADSDEARALRPLQVAACTYRIAFGPRVGQKVFTVQGADFPILFARTSCGWRPRRTTSASATATPAPIPAAWEPIHRHRWSRPRCMRA